MAGHSHFKNMMHRKGRADKIRSKLFTKISREITVSAKLGTPDPEMNPRLRAAVQAAPLVVGRLRHPPALEGWRHPPAQREIGAAVDLLPGLSRRPRREVRAERQCRGLRRR